MNSRELARAVAEREQGRRRLKTTTLTVSLASVGVAGAVLAVLPGSTHAAVKSSGSASSSSAPASSSGGASATPSSSPSASSPAIQAPVTAPTQATGGGTTSGGS